MNQDEFTPLMDTGTGIFDYMKSLPPSSTWRRIVDRASNMPWEGGRWIGACHTTKTRDIGTFASICDNNDIKTLISIDYGDTGKCNFYKTDDIFGNSPAAMAFPV